MRIVKTSTMNKNAQDAASYIAASEEQYLWQVKITARFLAQQVEERPIILLSGPSGSGKTTTSFRLKEQLCELGVKTHTMSMDNYFMAIDDPRSEREDDGTIDFESPKRLDKELLDSHLEKLFNGEEFNQPVFDFANQKQLVGEKFQRLENEMVIVEGIHALNPKVTGKVSDHASGVYVSVRTRIEYGKNKHLHPSLIRLMRRLVRDKLFRNRKATQTLEFYGKVELGEERYITPYKWNAEHDIDTFLAYEAAAYKNFIVNELADLRDNGSVPECQEILNVLDMLDSVSLDAVPDDSLVREFIGGSKYKY